VFMSVGRLIFTVSQRAESWAGKRREAAKRGLANRQKKGRSAGARAARVL
jgi:hypothetical protein